MNSDVSTAVVVLAAGRGSRMRSERPKVLQRLAGRPLLSHVLDTAYALDPSSIHVVYGYGGDEVKKEIKSAQLNWVEQHEQLGTGHAVACALPFISDSQRVLVLCGDVPLVTPSTLLPLLQDPSNSVSLLTAQLQNPSGYGRIIRDCQNVWIEGIVEEKDASDGQKSIREVNTGILAAPAAALKMWLSNLSSENAQGEYYLTDIVSMAANSGYEVRGHCVPAATEVAGVNDFEQLAEAEAIWQGRQRSELMRSGMALPAPERVIIRGTVEFGMDCVIDADVLLEGDVVLGNGVKIGVGSVVRNSIIGDDTTIEPYSVIIDSEIGRRCQVGPFAHLRPATVLDDKARVGNFVETKAAQLGEGSKANHLSYLGDAEVGTRVNIGAGTITCNYDGANKHKTIIGNDAFIGSGTELVAPVNVGSSATIGAGTTLTRDAPQNCLTVGRSRQKSISGWQRPGSKNDENSAEDGLISERPSNRSSE
ncbi:bifunctional UDP-N-acetylglucosamine diphosphorylase/glucosamine-1-phosphate N-acetyltransferase GlmU [Halorhodospira halochloris]|uniref:bifunctional UDP-N-acetylglucosamine diphosphorylase/glucosamine-1-phosphate N-acetyltransferase GlmU n=1 Tax=Halorhodospira halochloris TaxID=1052 RepID=UPI0023780B34|nr:bifunctional UDP-N-acetylglucosamine diphosphorylase/glucosamine-1-phosphate N-acetyltransferase GlmU [Halorhodospira halochloris]